MIEFEQYFSGILDNKIVACDSMKRISEKLLDDYIKPNEFHFDYNIAKNHIEFIEKFCKQPKGQIGKPLKLELFQKARFQAIFGFVDDNNLRQYNEVLTIEGRKNGKTVESGATELDMLMNGKEGAPEIYNVATKLDQAKLGFNACLNMVNQSPLLKKNIKKRSSDLYFPYNMGFIKAVSSNTNGLDGFDSYLVVIDELAAIKNRDLYDLMKQSMASRSQPLLFCISTNGFIRNGVFDAQYEYAKKFLKGELKHENKRFLPFIYELDDPSEWDKEDCWIKANPGLCTIKKLDFLRDSVRKAQDDPAYKPTVMVKDFNIPQSPITRWLTYEMANNEETFDISFDYAIGGFDAADKIDLCSAVAVCKRPGDDREYVKSMFWIPEKALEDISEEGSRRERDNAPYRLWSEQGYLRTCKGSKVDKKIILEWYKELRDEEDLYILYIGYDPWHIDDSLLREFKAEFGENSMVPVRQGVKSLSEPMKDLKAEFIEHNIIYNNNPLLKWCFLNTEIKIDINDNIQPVKSADRRNRIDGMVALICAHKVLLDNMDNYINLNEGV